VEAKPEDWLVVQAYEKPYINLLWLGTVIMFVGFGLAIFRRASDMMHRATRGLW
jgi:cytochrome c-type biogenesis protein CcmF